MLYLMQGSFRNRNRKAGWSGQEGSPVLKLLDRDEVGQKAVNDGIWFYLTPCCEASVTGVSVTAHNPAGVACRACYAPVDPRLAAAGWMGEEEK